MHKWLLNLMSTGSESQLFKTYQILNNLGKVRIHVTLLTCNNVSKFHYSIFICSSTCFGRHTAHHQEPKTVLTASGFAYMEGCWTCSWLDVVRHTVPDNVHQLHVQQPSTYKKLEAVSAALGS